MFTVTYFDCGTGEQMWITNDATQWGGHEGNNMLPVIVGTTHRKHAAYGSRQSAIEAAQVLRSIDHWRNVQIIGRDHFLIGQVVLCTK